MFSYKQMETVTKLPLKKKQRWCLLLAFSLLILSLLLLATISPSSSSSSSSSSFSPTHLPFLKNFYRRRHPKEAPHFVESKLESLSVKTRPLGLPRLAYLVSGSSGDVASLRRMVKALYHPRNQYVVHLDLEASALERLKLVRWVRGEKVFRKVGNVRVVVRSNLITYRGPTMVSNTLHAAAILLKDGGEWDWFINLSASDYPLVTQDDLLHALSDIPRDLNFIEHTSDIGWKEFQRARPVIIDPGLYSPQKSDVFWVTEKRSVPTAYKLFTGSAWMMLSREFVEYCIWGWDNLPRIVLMYYSNFLSSPEGYFHTVICNSEEFRNTTVNHDLHFISWDNPPKQHPHFLTVDDYQRMVDSNAPFARKFGNNNDVLDKIDSDILGRSSPDSFVPSSWFNSQGVTNLNTTKVKPGPGSKRLKQLITGLLSAEDFKSKHCI